MHFAQEKIISIVGGNLLPLCPVPVSETHRLTNLCKVSLELIEVQSGSYIGEDDIVRFEDMNQRN